MFRMYGFDISVPDTGVLYLLPLLRCPNTARLGVLHSVRVVRGSVVGVFQLNILIAEVLTARHIGHFMVVSMIKRAQGPHTHWCPHGTQRWVAGKSMQIAHDVRQGGAVAGAGVTACAGVTAGAGGAGVTSSALTIGMLGSSVNGADGAEGAEFAAVPQLPQKLPPSSCPLPQFVQ